MTTVLEAVVLVLALAVIALVTVYSLVTGSPPVPSSRRTRAAMLALVPEDQSRLILELGSGFGGLARDLARQHPGAQVIGYERSPLPWLISAMVQAVYPRLNLRLLRDDYRAAPFEEAGLVVCYLMSPAMAALSPVLAQRLPPGALVLAATFALPGWLPVAEGRAEDMYRTPVYLYRVPESRPA